MPIGDIFIKKCLTARSKWNCVNVRGSKTRAFARDHNNKCPKPDCGKRIFPEEEPKYEEVPGTGVPPLEEIDDDPLEDQEDQDDDTSLKQGQKSASASNTRGDTTPNESIC